MTQYVADGHLGGYIKGGDSYTYCPVLWDHLLREFGARSVLDIGCAEGHAMRWFHSYGVEVTGIEGCQQAIDDHLMPAHVYQHDFTKGIFNAPKVDMIWCCEVLEHVASEFEPNLLATMKEAAPNVIAVTAAKPGQQGYHHVNCQTPEYWIARFASMGYEHEAAWVEHKKILFGESLGYWFYHNGLLFIRR